MIKNFIKKIGSLKRATIGFFENKFESVPVVNNDIRCFNIGKSILGKNIECYSIGNGKIKIAFISAMHGNEVGTFKLARNLLGYLHENRDGLKNFSFLVVPCLNPDGYDIAVKNPGYISGGRIGRFNARNIDLNRNFDVASFKRESIWPFGKNYSESEKVFCGDFGNSEPETKALEKVLLENGVVCSFFFHNSGGDVTGGNDDLSQKISCLYAKKAGFGIISENEWSALGLSGTTKEWCYDNNIAYIEVEGLTRYGSDWNNQKSAIEAVLEKLQTLL